MSNARFNLFLLILFGAAMRAALPLGGKMDDSGAQGV